MATPIPQRVLDRVWNHIDRSGGPDACWPWMLSCHPTGYGQTGWGEHGIRHGVGAHRAAWTAINGPIPGDLTVDHMCRNRRCCNPDHLQLLSMPENARLNAQAIAGACINGHTYVDGSFWISGRGHRMCGVCQQESRAKARANNPELVGRRCQICAVLLPPTRKRGSLNCSVKCRNASRIIERRAAV